MDNQESLTNTNELPSPQGNVVASTEVSHEFQPHTEQTSQGGQPDPAHSTTAQTAPQLVPLPDPALTVPSAPASSHTLSAADVDLIEKEWVQKAKAIVAATQGDPFLQNKEINKIKADYIKKRYNKDIKVASE